MIALLGPPPQKLIDREKHWRDIPWERSYPNLDGTWCNTAHEYYGGPFFDSKGMSNVSTPSIKPDSDLYIGYFTHPHSIPTYFKMEDYITCMTEEERKLFLDFVRKMLQWLPEDKKTAKELREDPWLRSGLD